MSDAIRAGQHCVWRIAVENQGWLIEVFRLRVGPKKAPRCVHAIIGNRSAESRPIVFEALRMVADKLDEMFSVLVSPESGSASGSRISGLGLNDEGQFSNIRIRTQSVYRKTGVKRLSRAVALRRQTHFQAAPLRVVHTFS